ncbi:MAG: zinc metallopeptidase [Flammeovirgaceae bacterium]
MIFIIIGVFALLGWIVSARLKSKFKKYSQIGLRSGMSGAEAAQRMLHDHGIHDVQITCVPGRLTDHYNPSDKTVNLSEDVYHGRHAAAVAVAAHECGHAVQHATAYSMLQLRSALVPVQVTAAKLLNIFMILGVLGIAFSWLPYFVVGLVICGAYGVMTLFSVITLPVEFDATARALKWIEEQRIVTSQEYTMSQDALKWAAMTYVVAALGSLAAFLYYIFVFFGND